MTARKWRIPGLANRPRPQFLSYDRNVYLLLWYTLGKGLQLTISAITINLYAYSLGFRSDFIGLLTGMPALGAFVAGVPVGMLADRYGRKPLILFSAAVTPVTLVAIALSANGPLLLTASFLNGLLASAYWVTNLPMLTESTTQEQRVHALALNSFLLLGMGALGSLIGGAVPEFVAHIVHQPATSVIPMRWGVLASALVAAVPALPLVLIREPQRHLRSAATTDISPEGGAAVAEAQLVAPAMGRDPATRLGLVALFAMLLIPDVIFVMGESSVVGLEQLFFRLRYNLQPGPLGEFLAIAGLVGGASALLSPRLVKRWGRLRMATTLQMLSIPVALTIGFAPNLWLSATGECIRGVLRGLFEPVYAAFAMESISSRYRATLSGFYGITWGVGYSLGASFAGLLQAHVDLRAPFAIGAVCFVIAPVLLLTFFGRKHPPTPTPQSAIP